MSKKSKAKRVPAGTPCAYCGEPIPAGKGTRDHLIARQFFAPEHRGDPTLIQVPACNPCNNDKSHNEDYVRDYLISDAEVNHRRVPDAVYKAMLRSAQYGSSRVARAAMERGLWVVLPTGPAYSYPFEHERVTMVLEMIARGLYYHRTGRPLPRGARIECRRVTQESLPLVIEAMLKHGASVLPPMGNGECVIMHMMADDGTRVGTCTLVLFYMSMGALVSTEFPPDDPAFAL